MAVTSYTKLRSQAKKIEASKIKKPYYKIFIKVSTKIDRNKLINELRKIIGLYSYELKIEDIIK